MTTHRQGAPSLAYLDRPHTGLGRLARFLLRHRKVVGLFWLVVAVVGIALVGPIAGRLTSSEALPGLPSYQAGLAITHIYGNGGDNTPIVSVVTLPGTERVDSPAGRAALERDVRWAALTAIIARRFLPCGGRLPTDRPERPRGPRARVRR